MIVNIVLIMLIVAGLIYIGARFIKELKKGNDNTGYEEDYEDKNEYDIKFLVRETAETFSKTLRKRFEDENLTREELARKNRRTADLRTALTQAKYGDKNAKLIVKGHIKDLLLSDKYEIQSTIDQIIPFENPEKMRSLDKFEILLYFYTKAKGIDGLATMIDEYELTTPEDYDGTERYAITKETISAVYKDAIIDGNSDVLGIVEIDFDEKIEILAQRIFERYIGFGPVDMIYSETNMDEIDCGVSGIPAGVHGQRAQDGNLPYSFESVWIMYHGLNIQMECLSFETQSELIRVCENIYKYDAPYVMSRSEGRVAAEMIDGSRIVVCRPPFAESFSFFLRKFDSAPGTRPSELIGDMYNVIPIVFLYYILLGEITMLITGEQGCGKTTMLRAVIRYIRACYNLRVQEMMFELNLRYSYPYRNIETFQETANISAQEGLNLQKKTNGAVNIMGEIAEKEQAGYFVQTAHVASNFGLGTHHGKTAEDTVDAIADNLLQIGLFIDKKDAVRAAAEVINIDCHLAKGDGIRYIERITEIIPAKDIKYPSEKETSNVKDDAFKDATEYFHRVTDPKLFYTRNILHWEETPDGPTPGKFVLDNMPTENTMRQIRKHLNIQERERFDHDMEMVQRVVEDYQTGEMQTWMHKVLSY